MILPMIFTRCKPDGKTEDDRLNHFVARISLFVLENAADRVDFDVLYHFGTFAFTFGRQIYSEGRE